MAVLPSLDNLRGVLQKVIFVPIVYGFISLLPMFLSGWETSDRLTDRLFSVVRSRENTFDFIVVGGGTAGALVANRLAEHYSVLLLEAGGTPSPFQSIPALALKFLNHPQTDWSHKTVPQRKACLNSVNQQSSWSSGRGLGGTTNINFMVHTRGHPMDFENWAQITGDPSWGYQGVLPYFKRCETFSGTSNDPEARGHDGELRIRKPSYVGLSEDWVRAGQELGYPFVDLNGRHEEGFGILQYPIYKGIRQSTYSTFLIPMHKSPRLTIRRYALVRKILFRDMNNMAYGVEYLRHGSLYTAIATREVLLTSGTLGSSKLLMLSGVGPKAHLEELGIPVRSDLPVGRNLQDHLGVHLGPFFIREPRSFLFDRDVTPENIVRWLFLGTGPITTTGYQGAASIASSYAKSRGEGNWPDLQLVLHGQAIHKGYADAFAYAYGLQEDDLSQYYANAFGRDSFHITVVGSRPSSTGQVLLSGSSISDPLVINPKYLEDGSDLDYKVLLEGVKTAMGIANSSIFQRLGTEFTTAKLPGCDEHSLGTDAYWSCYIRRYTLTMHNAVGTASLGAVVDSNLRVLGTRALRVVDASVQPTIIGVGTAASTFMISEKGVDMILKDHGIPDRDTDLFDVVFGRNGFFKKNPILRILQREFDTLNPLRAIFKPFTTTRNNEQDARERFTRNSGINNPILQVISSLLGNSNGQADPSTSASETANAVDLGASPVSSFTGPPYGLDKRLGEPQAEKENVISKSQWVLQTSESSRYTTPPQPQAVHSYPSKALSLGKGEYARLQIPDVPTVKGKGGRRYALLQAILQEAKANSTSTSPKTRVEPVIKQIVETVKLERVNATDALDMKVVAKPIAVNPYNLGILPVSPAAPPPPTFGNNGPGKPNPFNDLIKHLKTFENFILSLTAKDRPRSWSFSTPLAPAEQGTFTVAQSQNPFHVSSTNNNALSNPQLSTYKPNSNPTKGPVDIGFGTAKNGSTNPFQFLFGGSSATGKGVASSSSNESSASNSSSLFKSWFNPEPKKESSSSWFKPFEATPSPSSSWFNPFRSSDDKPNPLLQPISFLSSWFQPSSQQKSSSNQAAASTWFKPFNIEAESDTLSAAVAVTTPASLPPTSDPFADLFELLFGGLKRHERRAIYDTLASMAGAGHNIAQLVGGSQNANGSNSSFLSPSPGDSHTPNSKENRTGSLSEDSYRNFLQSIASLNSFFNQYTSTTTSKPHPLVEYLNTFSYPPSGSTTLTPKPLPVSASEEENSV